jgi:hypothetical protein
MATTTAAAAAAAPPGPLPADPSEVATTTANGESSSVAAPASAIDIPTLPEDTAETAAAAAALVVDSVVEGTVAAVITNNQLPSSSSVEPKTIWSSTAPAAPATITTDATSDTTGNGTTSIKLPQESPSAPTPAPTPTATPAPVADNTTAAMPTSAADQPYNNQQKSKRKERLEQNRISARESRKRKKSMIEELQRTVITLTTENKELNGRNQSLRSNLAEIGRKVRAEKMFGCQRCKSRSSLCIPLLGSFVVGHVLFLSLFVGWLRLTLFLLWLVPTVS